MPSADRIKQEWEKLQHKLEERQTQDSKADEAQRTANEAAVAVASVESATQAADVDVGCESAERRSSTGMDHSSVLFEENDRVSTKEIGHDGAESIEKGETATLESVRRASEHAEGQNVPHDPTEGLGGAGEDTGNAYEKVATELGEEPRDEKGVEKESDAMAANEDCHGRCNAEDIVSKSRNVDTGPARGLQSKVLSELNVDMLESSDTESSDGDKARWPTDSGGVDGAESSLGLASIARDACSEAVHGDKDAVVSWMIGRMGLLEKVGL